MFLKPKAGLIVPNPDNKSKPLLQAGQDVTYSDYWRRRIKDGDVEKAKPETAKKTAVKS